MKKDIFDLHHIGIYCANREESIDFYCDVLGFTLEFTTEAIAGNGFLKIAFVRKNGFNVELLELEDPSRVRAEAESTWNHFGMYVADLEAVVARIKADGRARFEPDGILDVPGLGKEDIHCVFFRGINGERIELLQAMDVRR